VKKKLVFHPNFLEHTAHKEQLAFKCPGCYKSVVSLIENNDIGLQVDGEAVLEYRCGDCAKLTKISIRKDRLFVFYEESRE